MFLYGTDGLSPCSQTLAIVACEIFFLHRDTAFLPSTFKTTSGFPSEIFLLGYILYTLIVTSAFHLIARGLANVTTVRRERVCHLIDALQAQLCTEFRQIMYESVVALYYVYVMNTNAVGAAWVQIYPLE